MRSKKALKNIIVSIMMQLVAVIYGFIVPRIIIKQYGSEINGLMASITQFLGYITLLEAGFGPVVKAALYKPLANKNYQQIANVVMVSERFFRKIAAIFLVYILVLTIVYPLCINTGYDFIFTASMILIIAASTFAEYFFGLTYQLLLHAAQATYVAAGLQAAIYVVGIIITVVLAKFGVDVRILKASICVLYLIKPIILNMYARKKFKIKEQQIDKTFVLKNKWDGLAQHIAAVINEKTDTVVLTIFVGLKSVSIYSVYYLVSRSLNLLINSIMNGVSATFGDIIAKKELDLLERRFNAYETVYLTLVTILYSAAMCLIIPFISTYTAGIHDADYIQPVFAVIFIASGLVYALRLPYIAIVTAAGKFKETKKGAVLEAVLNIVVSVLCVIKLGLVGVAIGTLVAQTVRTIELVCFTNKNIIGRSIKNTVAKISIMSMAIVASAILPKVVPYYGNGYLDLVVYALKLMVPMGLTVLLVNIVLHKKDFADMMKTIRKKK